MLALIINLWIMIFIFVGSVIACLDETKKELKKQNEILERVVNNLYILDKTVNTTINTNTAKLRDSLSDLVNNFTNFFKILTKRGR